ncbi:MAG: O-antigen ligase family protein [Polaribacter sp.]|nr:O-antigen ligase family protein [Polaribacter sp.]
MAVIFPTFTNVYKKINLPNILEILLILILVTLPLGGFAINSIAVILFFIASILNYLKNKPTLVFSKIFYSFFAIYSLFLLSLVWTDNLQNSLDGLVRFLSYLVLPIAFLLNSNLTFNKEKVVGFFSKSLVFYAIYCVLLGAIKALIHNNFSYLFYHELSGNLSNLNAIYLSVFTSFGISYFLFKNDKSRFDKFGFAFLSFFLVLLSSKIIIITTFLGFLLYFLKKINIRKINVRYLLLIIGFSIVFGFSSSNLKERIQIEFEKTNLQEVLTKKDFGHVYLWTGTGLRIFQIKAFIEILKEQKKGFLGLGLNNSQKYLNDKYEEYNLYPGFLNYNFHNQYIQIFAELGLVGFLLFSTLFYCLLKNASINKDYFFMSFIFLILVVCFTESFLWRQRGMVFFILISLIFSQRKPVI